MNYFSELIESYGKLKKRTYKLTFINEDSVASTASPEATAAASEILGIIGQVASSGQAQEQKGVSFSSPEFKAPASNDAPSEGEVKPASAAVTVAGFSGNWPNGKKAKMTGAKSWNELLSPAKIKNSNSVGFALVSFWLDGGATDDMRNNQKITDITEKQQEISRRKTIDGSLEETPYIRVSAILNNSYKKIAENIRLGYLNMTTEVALAQIVLGNHGNRAGGFIKQLKEGEVRKLNKDGTKSVKGGKVSEAQAVSMAKKFDILANSPSISPGTREAERFCKKVNDEKSPLIGLYKGNPVIYGADTTESLVFPTVNKLLDGALKQVENLCGKTEDDLSQVPSDTVDSNSLNGIRGTFFEDISVFAINIMGAKTQEERKAFAEEFKLLIKEKRLDLEKIISMYGDDPAALDLELFAEADYQKELFDILNSVPAFKKYLYKELSLVKKFTEELKATSSVRTGGGNAAGGDRDDIIASFSSQKDAAAAGKLFDVDAYEEEGTWKISVGSKRYIKGTEGKMGEVNSDDQLNKNMNPAFRGNKNYNAEGMKPRILKELFGWDGRDNTFDVAEQRWEDSYNYYNGIQEDVDKLKSSFLDTEIYNVNGKTFLETPKKRAENLMSNLKSKLGYDSLENSPLKDVLYDTDADGNLSLVDLEDESTRERLAEKVGRLYKMQKINEGLNNEDTKEKASQAVMLMAYATGGNVKDLAQVFSQDSGTIVFSQTGLLRDLSKSKNRKVTVDGFTIKISDGKKEIGIGLERSGNKTRTKCSVSKNTMKAIGKSYEVEEEKINNSIEHILKGQITLLEAFLNQTNSNLPL